LPLVEFIGNNIVSKTTGILPFLARSLYITAKTFFANRPAPTGAAARQNGRNLHR
ncbi:hypothetical protein BT67DRAFT_389115, partial [Trichocladium antarcticum]